MKQYVATINPYEYVKTHIIKGDKSDGIPNILSDDDTFVNQKRQKPISQKKINLWINQEPTYFCTTKKELDNYTRNKILIDMDCIPDELEDKILVEYNTQLNKKETKVSLDYFKTHDLNDLIKKLNFCSLDVIKDEITVK